LTHSAEWLKERFDSFPAPQENDSRFNPFGSHLRKVFLPNQNNGDDMLPRTNPSADSTFLLRDELESIVQTLAPLYHSAKGDYNSWNLARKPIGDNALRPAIKGLTKLEAESRLKVLFPRLLEELERMNALRLMNALSREKEK
jgi:hypothetical protein